MRTRIKQAFWGVFVVGTFMLNRDLNANLPDDNKINFGIEEAFREDPRIFSGGINVSTKGGIVKLAGTVYNLAEKNYALKEAKKIDGVVSVIDTIDVQPAFVPDDRITENILHRFRSNSVLHSDKIDVKTRKGFVTLTGKVSSMSKQDEATLIVSQVAGVKSILNKLEVIRRQSVADEDIEADLLETIRRDVYLTGLPIQVSVKDGVVVLSGQVANAYQKDRAETKTLWIRNIAAVRNGLVVDPKKERGERNRRPQLTDEQLRNAILSTLTLDSRISESASFDVRVESGHVALRGIVPTTFQREIAEQDVRNVVGVAWVSNLLLVFPERRTDPDIEEDINTQFDTDYMLLGLGLKATCKDSAVTLSGNVNTAYAKTRAGQLVRRIQGIRQVVNNISVEEPRIYRNAALRKRIQERLALNWETALIADSIKVSIKNGKATLDGVVQMWGQRKEAERVAYFTDGIWAVDNRLKVGDTEYDWEKWYFDYPNTYIDEFYPGFESYYYQR